MGLIESATRRLDTLARAGIVVPGVTAPRRSENSDVRSDARAPCEALWTPARSVEMDLEALGQSGYLTPALGRSQLADEFRRPKRVLLHNAQHPPKAVEDRGALIMVTSALPGEGKTFCALNLALSMAMEVHTEVLLVDADTVRPSVMQRLGLQAERGLTELLADSTLELRDVALATNVPKLSVLPSGQPHQQAHELFASERMSQLLTQWLSQSRHRLVVMDAPACLVSSEATALAAMAGQIVVVVRADETPRALVDKAFEALKDAPLVYAILNQCTELPTAQKYGEAYAPPVYAMGSATSASTGSLAADTQHHLEPADV